MWQYLKLRPGAMQQLVHSAIGLLHQSWENLPHQRHHSSWRVLPVQQQRVGVHKVELPLGALVLQGKGQGLLQTGLPSGHIFCLACF